MPDFNQFSKDTLNELQGMLSKELNDHTQEALADAQDFLRRSKEDLDRWLKLLAEGKLTPADFEWLLRGKKDLAKMQALKQAGVSAARLQQFQGALVLASVQAASTGLGMALDSVQVPTIKVPTIKIGGKSAPRASRSGPPAKKPAAKAKTATSKAAKSAKTKRRTARR